MTVLDRSAASGEAATSGAPQRLVERSIRRRVAPLAFLGVMVGLWQVIPPLAGIGSYLMPTPAEVWSAFAGHSGAILAALATTCIASGLAFGVSTVLGVGGAILIAHSRVVEDTVTPLLIVLWTAPTVAIAPVVVVWLGVGYLAIVVISVVVCFFPIVTNTVIGLRSASSTCRDLFMVYDAHPIQRLIKLELPSALPEIIAAMKITAALAVVGVVSGEYVAGAGGGTGGLGYVIIVTGSRLETPYLFAASILSALLGMITYWLVSLLGRKVLGSWHESAMERPS